MCCANRYLLRNTNDIVSYSPTPGPDRLIIVWTWQDFRLQYLLQAYLLAGATMDVTQWLRTLGFERCNATFRANDVSVALLPSLTAEDLRELGVTSVGHRRQMLKAIARLRSQAALPADGVQPGSARPAIGADNGPSSRSTGERRPLSVMSCDLVGSTELASRLDPEGLGRIIRAYQACVREPIARFHGFIARYVGDRVLVYFGWPETSEVDAERAVRAGLAVVAAIGREPVGGELLQVRIGIATGLVMVGEAIGAGCGLASRGGGPGFTAEFLNI